MKWSLNIGEYRGIPVKIYPTFLLIIIWVASHWMQGNNLQTTLTGIVFVLALFACVVLHEFRHALTARRFNIKTIKIEGNHRVPETVKICNSER